MGTQILEGSLAEIRQGLSSLMLEPDAHLRLLLDVPVQQQTKREVYKPTEFLNGVPLLPRRELKEPITLELVKRILNEDIEDG